MSADGSRWTHQVWHVTGPTRFHRDPKRLGPIPGTRCGHFQSWHLLIPGITTLPRTTSLWDAESQIKEMSRLKQTEISKRLKCFLFTWCNYSRPRQMSWHNRWWRINVPGAEFCLLTLTCNATDWNKTRACLRNWRWLWRGCGIGRQCRGKHSYRRIPTSWKGVGLSLGRRVFQVVVSFTPYTTNMGLLV